VNYRIGCLCTSRQYEVIDDWQVSDARDGQHGPWSPGRSSSRVQGARHAGGAAAATSLPARSRTPPRPSRVPLSGLGGHGIGACAGSATRRARSSSPSPP